MESSVCHPSPPNTYSCVQEEILVSSRKCVDDYLLFLCISNKSSVVPMEITFMDTEDKYLKHGTLGSLRYIYSNPFRFPISSLGSPIFLLGIAEREQWQNMPPTANHWPDRTVTHKKLLHFYHDRLNFCILLFIYISTPNPLFYWSIWHYYNSCLLSW